jgi:hypothetical protein
VKVVKLSEGDGNRTVMRLPERMNSADAAAAFSCGGIAGSFNWGGGKGGIWAGFAVCEVKKLKIP